MTRIQLRRDTSTNWVQNNPIPAQGEPCYETDTGKLKIGDGVTPYNDLPQLSTGGSGSGGVSIKVHKLIPTIHANGTLGGDTPAVSGNFQTSVGDSGMAYNAFEHFTNTFWCVPDSSVPQEIIYYTPVPRKFSKAIIRFKPDTEFDEAFTAGQVLVSNTNENDYVEVGSFTDITANMVGVILNCTEKFKYIKFNFTAKASEANGYGKVKIYLFYEDDLSTDDIENSIIINDNYQAVNQGYYQITSDMIPSSKTVSFMNFVIPGNYVVSDSSTFDETVPFVNSFIRVLGYKLDFSTYYINIQQEFIRIGSNNTFGHRYKKYLNTTNKSLPTPVIPDMTVCSEDTTPWSSDLNNYTDTGFYYFTSIQWNSLANKPTTPQGENISIAHLIVLNSGSKVGNITQILYTFNGGGSATGQTEPHFTYTRHGNGNNSSSNYWSPWRREIQCYMTDKVDCGINEANCVAVLDSNMNFPLGRVASATDNINAALYTDNGNPGIDLSIGDTNYIKIASSDTDNGKQAHIVLAGTDTEQPNVFYIGRSGSTFAGQNLIMCRVPAGDTVRHYYDNIDTGNLQENIIAGENITTSVAEDGKITINATGSGTLPDNVTTQGNTFNGANQLVQLDASGKLPAIDGSQLTNLPGGSTDITSFYQLDYGTESGSIPVTFSNNNITIKSGIPITTPNGTFQYTSDLTYEYNFESERIIFAYKDDLDEDYYNMVAVYYGGSQPDINPEGQIAWFDNNVWKMISITGEITTFSTQAITPIAKVYLNGNNVKSIDYASYYKIDISNPTPSNMVTTDTTQTITGTKTFETNLVATQYNATTADQGYSLNGTRSLSLQTGVGVVLGDQTQSLNIRAKDAPTLRDYTIDNLDHKILHEGNLATSEIIVSLLNRVTQLEEQIQQLSTNIDAGNA